MSSHTAAAVRCRQETWRLREPRGIHQLDADQRSQWTGSQFDQSPNLEYEPGSPTLACVNDLCDALDHGVNPRGGEHGSVPLGNSELMFGLIESHAHGGAKIALPLTDHGNWRLARQGLGGNTPKYRRDESDIAEGLERAMAETVPARL